MCCWRSETGQISFETGQTSLESAGGKFSFRAHEESQFVAGGRGCGGWSGEFVGGQFAILSPPRAQYKDGEVVALRWRGGTAHGLHFVDSVLLQVEKVGCLGVVTVVVFVEVALIGDMLWSVLTPLSALVLLFWY
jgi:hypothetical protein